MTITVKVLADSITENRYRLTTLECTYPRFIHSELMTHRTFCLSGSSELEFELPGGQHNRPDGRRVFRMKLSDFADKWHNGARRFRGTKPKNSLDLSLLDDSTMYQIPEICKILGCMQLKTNFHTACRNNELLGAFKRQNSWYVSGKEFKNWRSKEVVENRYDMKKRLRSMRIRQLNTDTGDIQLANVTDVIISGVKETYKVSAGSFNVTGSKDHLIFTENGWKTISQLNIGEKIAVRKFGKTEEDKLDPLRFKKINGRWRSSWQISQRTRMISESPKCRNCFTYDGTDIHHIIPVYINDKLAFDEANITLLCKDCHAEQHIKQGWQGDTYLYADMVAIDSVVFAGIEETYDLSISGDYDNFLANGVVVHNSRNAASSRAIPVRKMIERIKENPAMPIHWGKNISGMQAREELPSELKKGAKALWLEACANALRTASTLEELGVHKQVSNRILEPFQHITTIVSATDWDNFFKLRISEQAQPELCELATLMRDSMAGSYPMELSAGDYHAPFLLESEEELAKYDTRELCLISAARCARVSYLTHNGVRDPDEDLKLATKLLTAGHFSPFEHIATPSQAEDSWANFKGWKQFRRQLEIQINE